MIIIGFKLILGDCLEKMREMQSQSVDVVFTSPPYNDSGTTELDKEKKRHMKYENFEFREDWFDWQCECIDEMVRVCQRMVLYNIQALLSNKADVYRMIGKYADTIHQILIWYKPNAQPQSYPNRIGNSYEMVFILKGKQFKNLEVASEHYNNVIVKNISANHVYSDQHRALMSEPFCDEIIREFTKPGETILDPFMGLATTGISCYRQGRNFIGIEIHEPYFNIAKERLEAEQAQMSLFDGGE